MEMIINGVVVKAYADNDGGLWYYDPVTGRTETVNEEDTYMKCPYCKSDRHTVSFSGNSEDDRTRLGYYRRKRKCLDCGRKFWTVEEYVPSEQIRRGKR